MNPHVDPEIRAEIVRRMNLKHAKKIIPVTEIKFSYHPDIQGKPVKDAAGKLVSNGKQVNLGYGWQTVELPFNDLYIMLSEGGYAVAPALNSDHRNEQNFTSHQVALVDIDSGMKLEELKNFSFYNNFGSGYYTTPSHTDTDHRFRIIYRLQSPITDPERMRSLYLGLLMIHGAADVSCKDSARLFYGTINAAHREITNRFLTDEEIENVIKLKPLVHTPPTVNLNVVYKQVGQADMIKHLDELKKHYPLLEYHTRFKISKAVQEVLGGNMIGEMRSRWPDHTLNGKYEDMAKNSRTEKPATVGSIIEMIRQYDPMYMKARATIKPRWVANKNDEELKELRMNKRGKL